MIEPVIDFEFRDLIPPLSAAELEGLEADIVEVGRALVPLMVWNGILVDGHNRHAICIIVPALIVLNPEARKGPICACECWV